MARLNLCTLSDPVPPLDPNQPPLIPDNVQWEIMSRSGSTSTDVNPQARIRSWARGIRPDDLQSNGIITTRKAHLFKPGYHSHPGIDSSVAEQMHGMARFPKKEISQVFALPRSFSMGPLLR